MSGTDLPSALNEIDRSSREILAALIHSFVLGSALLELNDAFRCHKPTPEQAAIHERFLTDLLKIAVFISQRTRHLPPSDLAGFVSARDRLLELNGRDFGANKAILSFFLAEWKPWATDGSASKVI
jgi:hypothetical protein